MHVTAACSVGAVSALRREDSAKLPTSWHRFAEHLCGRWPREMPRIKPCSIESGYLYTYEESGDVTAIGGENRELISRQPSHSASWAIRG